MTVKLIRILSVTKREFSYHATIDTAIMRLAQERMQNSECFMYVAYEVKRKAAEGVSEKLGRKVMEISISPRAERLDYRK